MRGTIGRLAARAAAAALGWVASTAGASFHLYQINQIYSDTTGNVQYVDFYDSFPTPLGDGQYFLAGNQLMASAGANTNVFTFPSDLPATPSTSHTHFLVGTQGFADLHIVTPDYIVPNGFLFKPGGSITYAGFADSVTYASLPSDGSMAIDRNGVPVPARPTNFAGATGCLPAPAPAGPYDVDGNGAVDALTDGLMLIRYMFGLRGASLIASAVGPCATRSTSAAIETHISTQIP